MAPKVDPKMLEREYVTTDVSIRELARRYDMSWSAIATRARKPDSAGLTWQDKKHAFSESLSARTYDRTVEKFASEEADIREELVLIHRATIHAYAQQLREGKIVVSPKDAVLASQTLLLLIGEATSRTENRTIEISANLPLEDLRQLAEFARTKLVEGAMEESPRSLSEGTLQN